jgi:hypothetical protein
MKERIDEWKFHLDVFHSRFEWKLEANPNMAEQNIIRVPTHLGQLAY